MWNLPALWRASLRSWGISVIFSKRCSWCQMYRKLGVLEGVQNWVVATQSQALNGLPLLHQVFLRVCRALDLCFSFSCISQMHAVPSVLKMCRMCTVYIFLVNEVFSLSDWLTNWKALSHVWLLVTPWTVHGIFEARILEYSLSFLQGISPTQGSSPGLLHYRWILHQLSH